MPEASLPAPRLIVFTDLERASAPLIVARFEGLAKRALPFSVLFTVRDYAATLRARLELSLRVRELGAEQRQYFGVADRVDVALGLGAQALHLPERGLRDAEARTLLPASTFISRALHTWENVPETTANALLLSPILAARKGRPALGVKGLGLARAALSVHAAPPALFALGGIDASNAESCLRAGAQGVAVIGAALAEDPAPLLLALGILR